MKILYNIGLLVKEAFQIEESKDKGSYPMWAKAFHDVFYAIEKDKKVRLIFSVVDFTVFLLIPNIYYGLIRGNLYRNF